VVLAFRRTACPQANYTVRPGGLRDQIEYEVEDMDTGCRTFHTGKDLAAGLRLDAERTPASIALIYRPRG